MTILFIHSHWLRFWLFGRRSQAITAVCMAITAGGCSVRQQVYLRDPSFELNNAGKTILLVTVDTIAVEYVDRTNVMPDTTFSDSFFIDAANSLFAYEASKRFKLRANPDDSTGRFDELCGKLRAERYSRLVDGTDSLAVVSGIVKEAAARAGADLVLIPYSCRLNHIMYQARTWRGGGPSYERPVTFRASAFTHAQIWNSRGELLYERIGTTDAGRPVMYSLLGKKQPGKDVVKFAKNMFAPPLVRSMYMSIQNAMKMPQ